MPAVYPVSYTTVSLMAMTLPDIGSITTLTSAHIALYAGMAQTMVDAKIARFYTLPFTVEVPKLQEITTELGLYYLLTRRIFTAQVPNNSTWPDRYREAMAQLDAIAAGELLLVDSSGTVIAGRTDIAEVFSTTMNYVPTFHEGPWSLQIQDADKIEDELERRGITVTDRII